MYIDPFESDISVCSTTTMLTLVPSSLSWNIDIDLCGNDIKSYIFSKGRATRRNFLLTRCPNDKFDY